MISNASTRYARQGKKRHGKKKCIHLTGMQGAEGHRYSACCCCLVAKSRTQSRWGQMTAQLCQPLAMKVGTTIVDSANRCFLLVCFLNSPIAVAAASPCFPPGSHCHLTRWHLGSTAGQEPPERRAVWAVSHPTRSPALSNILKQNSAS